MTDRTDEEIVDLIRSWLRQYGLTVVGGLGLGIAGVLGYEWWQSAQITAAKKQAAQIIAIQQSVQAGKTEEAQALLADFDDAKGEMADMALMLLAKGQAQAGDKAAAKENLHKVAGSQDVFVAQTARWHLAQLAAEENKWDEVLNHTQQLQASMYAVPALELKALAYRAQNDLPKALAALEDAHSLVPNPFLEVQIQALKLQMMTRGS